MGDADQTLHLLKQASLGNAEALCDLFLRHRINPGILLSDGSDQVVVYGPDTLSKAGNGVQIGMAVVEMLLIRYAEWVVNQYFEIHHYQPLLYVVDSFQHLFDEVDRLETWMKDGKLNNVSPGEPHANEEDLRSFLDARKPTATTG